MRLARQGKLITHHTDHAVLTLMSLDSVIDRDYQGVDPDMELGQIVHKISRSRHNVLPVLDAAGILLGEINIVKIRHVVFRTELYHHFKAGGKFEFKLHWIDEAALETALRELFSPHIPCTSRRSRR